MQSTWTGKLSFGMVTMPVKLYKATEDHDVAFRQHHGPDCHGRIGMTRVCKDCGEVVEYGDVEKGLDVDGQTVILSKAELAALADEQGKTIEIVSFADASSIDPTMFENAYFLGSPDAAKPYALLASTMAPSKAHRNGLVAIATVMLRSKTQMAMLRVQDGLLVMHTLRWPDEMRSHAELNAPTASLSAAEKAAAKMLVDSMIADFDPSAYTDTYTDRLKELIASKCDGGQFASPETAAEKTSADVTDLLARLEASIQKRKDTAA